MKDYLIDPKYILKSFGWLSSDFESLSLKLLENQEKYQPEWILSRHAKQGN